MAVTPIVIATGFAVRQVRPGVFRVYLGETHIGDILLWEDVHRFQPTVLTPWSAAALQGLVDALTTLDARSGGDPWPK